MAHVHNWPVIDLQVRLARDGVCHTIMPMQPLEMPGKFRATPLQTRRELVQIISVLIAPSLVLGVAHSAGDEGDLTVWEHVWDKCRWGSYWGDPWAMLYGEAEDAVHSWLQKPGTTACLERVAQELARRRYIDAETFKALLRPSPPARPVAAVKQRPPTPAPAPVAVQTAAPRAPVPQLQPQPQPQPQSPSWEHLVWAYSQFFGHSRGGVPLSPFIPRLMRGSGRLLMS
jgi:hypothetical protein